MSTRSSLCAAVFLTLAGCETTVVRAARNPNVAAIRGPIGGGPGSVVVPKGTQIEARINRTIDTVHSHRGDAFNAYLTAPIVAHDGTVIAPIGAPIVGHVVDLQEGRSPMILLGFDAVETRAGFQPLQVSVRSAADVVYEDRHAVMIMPPAPIGVGERYYGPTYTETYFNTVGPQAQGPTGLEYVGHPREGVLPSGGSVRLTLTEPLIVPAAQRTNRERR
jgi:hypothetical protein